MKTDQPIKGIMHCPHIPTSKINWTLGEIYIIPHKIANLCDRLWFGKLRKLRINNPLYTLFKSFLFCKHHKFFGVLKLYRQLSQNRNIHRCIYCQIFGRSTALQVKMKCHLRQIPRFTCRTPTCCIHRRYTKANFRSSACI